MKKCSSCNKRIAVGGAVFGDEIFCGDKCQKAGLLAATEDLIPEDIVNQEVGFIHHGSCPKCGGEGPNDLQKHYKIWSVIILTFQNEIPEICCRKCGVKKKLGGLFFSGLFGWWGFPVGVLLTPVLVILNLVGLFKLPKNGMPSKRLYEHVCMDLGARALIAKSSRQLQPMIDKNALRTPAWSSSDD
jgi:hypothetical protein